MFLYIDRILAKKIGLFESIIVYDINSMLMEKNDNNYYKNRYWINKSIKSFHEDYYSFMSYDTVKRAFKKLENMGILVVDNYNKDKRDRTKWYSLDYDKLSIC